MNRNPDKKGKQPAQAPQRGIGKQRSGIPLSAVGRKILPTELVAEKLSKKERRKAENPPIAAKKQSSDSVPQQTVRTVPAAAKPAIALP